MSALPLLHEPVAASIKTADRSRFGQAMPEAEMERAHEATARGRPLHRARQLMLVVYSRSRVPDPGQAQRLASGDHQS